MREPEAFAHLYAATGETARASKLLAEAEGQRGNFFLTAFGHLVLGNIDDALRWLDYGIDEHDPDIIRTLRMGNLWNELQDEPRYQALIGKLEAMETRTRM